MSIYKTDFSKIDTERYYYDEQAAESAVRYIESRVRHVKGEWAGQLVKLERWQKEEIIKPIFGWKHKGSGLRKYTSAYVEVPKKNGKTYLSAALAAIFLDIEPEPGEAAIYSIAGNKDQASLSFKETSGIIDQMGDMVSTGRPAEILRSSIIVGNKYFRPMSRESRTQQGVNPQLCIVDEVHVHQDADLIENMEKSMAARRQPLVFMITTAGSDLYGVGYQRHEYAVEVATGIREDQNLLVCIYAADKDDDPYDPKTWKKANPNYGVSVYPQAFEREIAKCKASQSSLNSFLRYHLNIWTQSTESWINDEEWVKSQWEANDYEHLPCYGALDLSDTRDMSAFCLLFDKGDGSYISKNWYYLPEDKIEQKLHDKTIPYADWVVNGVVTETPGNVIDYDYILSDIEQCIEKYDIQKIAYDPHNAVHIIPKIIEMGGEVEPFRQGFISMNAPTKLMADLIMKQKFNHQGCPVLRWMAGNAQMTYDHAGNIKLVKDKKRPEKKIDGIIANIMALGTASQSEVDSYMNDGNLFFV